MDKPNKKIYGFFSHHKCASTWFDEIFSEVCLDLGLRFEIVYKKQDLYVDLWSTIKERNIDFIAYANADFTQVAMLENLIGVHVVRDPRDIIVSAYFSHLKTHSTESWPELKAHRLKLQQSDQETGLFHEIAFREEQFDEMRSWKNYQGDNILLVRMEDATSKTYQSVLSIIAFMGLLDESRYGYSKRIKVLISNLFGNIDLRYGTQLPRMINGIPAERLLGIVWKNEFEKKSGGRKVGEENINSHYRKGVHGDWKNYLTKDHIALIKNEYNDVILQYGYEKNPDW